MKKKKFNIKFILFMLFVAYVSFTLINQQFTIAKLKKAQQQSINKIEKVNKENEKLKAMIENASSMEYIERMAREQLGLVKPGEKVYINQSAPDTDLQEGGN